MNVEILTDKENSRGVEVGKLKPGDCFKNSKNEYFIVTNQIKDVVRTVMGTDGSLFGFGIKVRVEPVKATLTIDLRKEAEQQ